MEEQQLNIINENMPPAQGDYLEWIRRTNHESGSIYIILDDDPTGTQTVYNVPVLTQWDESVIYDALTQGIPLFYILTNSRSLPAQQAEVLALEIGRNINSAAQKAAKKVTVVSRGDSTLRGHYPGEVDTLAQGLDAAHAIRVVAPAFFEGGRVTLDDIHYVIQDGKLVPAAQTPFAADKAFGYHASDLKDWVEEKTQGRVKASEVYTFSLEMLRQEGVAAVSKQLNAMPAGATCIVNAISYNDLAVFVLGLLRSEKPFLARVAASFVAMLGGLAPQPLLEADRLVDKTGTGGLVVVGSYVPKATAQTNHLLEHAKPHAVMLEVASLLDDAQSTALMTKTIEAIEARLKAGTLVLLYTSRKLVAAKTPEENLQIGNTVSTFITEVVARLAVRPRFLIAKGGITSSDVAVKSLGVKKATVIGQGLPGVPVWRIGPEAKFPRMPYIIFPGNVGSDEAITALVQKMMDDST